jgi:hypothetical protein
MTVSSETRKNSYSGNGTQTIFPYTFKIFEDADLAVTLRDSDGGETIQTLNSDYTVTGAGEDSGGNVIMADPVLVDESLVIERTLDYVQETDYVENDDFGAETHEEALDRIVMLVQQITGLLDRAFLVPTSDGGTSMEVPNEIARALKYLAFDAAGNPVTSSGSVDGLAVSSYWESILGVDSFQFPLISALAADGDWCGLHTTVQVDTNGVGFAAALYMAADGHYDAADADAAATMPVSALALEAGTGANKKVLLKGFIRHDAWYWTPGALVYASTTPGTLTQTPPSGTGDQVQVVGQAFSVDILYFNPSFTMVELI